MQTHRIPISANDATWSYVYYWRNIRKSCLVIGCLTRADYQRQILEDREDDASNPSSEPTKNSILQEFSQMSPPPHFFRLCVFEFNLFLHLRQAQEAFAYLNSTLNFCICVERGAT